MIIFLRSLLFNILYILWTFMIATLQLPLLLKENWAVKAGRPWALGVLLLARVICGIRHELRGAEFITQEPVIYASKHQSAWDTAVYLTLFDKPCYVLKKELLWLPLFGWFLARMGMIAIDRKGGASTIKKIIRDARITLEQKRRPVIIYPEGTRTLPGAAPHYMPGIVALYSQLKTPVIPVALNSGRYWGKKAFLKYPGIIVMQFLPPIPVGLAKADFSLKLQADIEQACEQL